MNRCVKNMFSDWDGTCDNNNVCDVLLLSCMIDIASNSEELSFSGHYIYYMMNSFGNNSLFSTDM